MEQGIDQSTHSSAAPALTRGLAILQLLAKEDALNLEQITKRLALPKASVHRLLETLEKSAMIRRTPEKHYEALWHLRPAKSALETFRSGLEFKMSELMEATQCTAEWYEPTNEGMQLILQKNPESELCVKARPGFLRDWSTELEAVTRLGLAFAKQAPSISRSQQYTANGKLSPLSEDGIDAQVQHARTKQSAYDETFNSNGVRRIAVAAFDHESDEFLGILAIAEIYHFARQNTAAQQLKRLQEILN